MAQVKKLMINGIRSFDPVKSTNQVIEFYSPMTLIVGENGCGKTTIIEALKFAITNDFPPGSNRGQTFVHDPKLSSGYEIAASVKLELEEKNGTKVVVTKRMKATMKGKAGAVSVQSLEGVIRRVINGEKTDITSKCMDMKFEMCRMMGVSEAILNNVIFCHQEDSCWPLTEGKKVKEKFDAIFNTTMYMKALDELTKKDKELGNNIKVAEAHLSGTTDLMKEKKQKLKKIETFTLQLASTTDLITKQEKDYDEIGAKLRVFQELDREYATISNAVTQAKTQIAGIQRNINEIKQNMTEALPGTLEELEKEYTNFQRVVSQQNVKLSNYLTELQSKGKECARLVTQKDKFLKDEGTFQQQEKENTARHARMKKMMEETIETVKKMKENSQEGSLSLTFSSSVDTILESFSQEGSSSVRPDNLLKALAVAIRSKESELKSSQEEFAEKEKEFQNELDSLNRSKASIQTEMSSKNGTIDKNTREAAELRKRLSAIEGSTDTLAQLQNEEEQQTDKIEAIEKSGIVAKCDKEIKAFGDDIQKLEKRRESIEEELTLLREDKKILDEIATHENIKLKKKQEVNTVKNKIQDQIQNLLESFPEVNLGKSLETKVKALGVEVQKLQAQLSKKERDLHKEELELKQTTQSLNKKEKTYQEWKSQIEDSTGEHDSFEAACFAAKEELDTAQKENYYAEAAQFLYKKYIRKLQKKEKKKKCNDCPLCHRDFATQKEVDNVIAELHEEIQKIQDSDETDKEKIEVLSEKHASLLKLKPRWEDVKNMETNQIPELKKTKETLEAKIATLKEEVEENTETLEVLRNDLAQGNDLVKDASAYDLHMGDFKTAETKIASLERRRNPAAKECTFTLPDAESEVQTINSSITAKRVEKEAKEKQRNNKREEFAKANDERNRIKSEILQITSEMQNREALEQQKKSFEDSINDLKSAVKELQKKLPQVNKDIASWETKKKDLSKEKEKILEKIRGEKIQLENNKGRINDINAAITEFETKTKVQYAEKQRQMQQCKEKLEEAENANKALSLKIDDLRTQIGNQEIRKRNLEDHISVKTKEAEITQLKQELGDKEATLAASTNRGATAERKELQVRYQALLENIGRSKGERTSTQKQLVETKKEIGQAPYLNLEADHCRNLVTKTVLTKAQKDIRLYKTALDQAIMQFHHKKMEKINQYLQFLWKRVYKGNDIDYIQIKTDNEDVTKGDAVVKVTAKKRVYNYRVVMFRMGVELDMRGRCSAGQKVLASIMIRMALAQTFSTKCGIITLDEPTTNLDRKNIESLAETLAQIAQDYKLIKTFQLVIITHDQDFIDKLLLSDPVDFYFKVSRDRQGFSQIQRFNR